MRFGALLVVVALTASGCSGSGEAPPGGLSGQTVQLAPGLVVAVELGAL